MSALNTAIYWTGDHIISPFGSGSDLNFQQVVSGNSAIETGFFPELSTNKLSIARITDQFNYSGQKNLTRLEQLFVHSLQSLIDENHIPMDEKTLIILSSTKGNIGLMGMKDESAIFISNMAHKIGEKIHAKNPLINVSNACISGSLAISVACRLLQSSQYERAIVTGGDELSKFIVSGFESFQALSEQPCKPFDKDRNGLNLGEAIASVYLTKTPENAKVKVAGIGSFNDANHISGPSRTGEGLFRSIEKAMQQSGYPQIDFISAHGTATLYNDEMESIAIERSGLSNTPVNSFKGIFGHTLGASGLLESILSVYAAQHNYLIASQGFQNQGTSRQIAVINKTEHAPINNLLKLASGFGGCNIATVFSQVT